MLTKSFLFSCHLSLWFTLFLFLSPCLTHILPLISLPLFKSFLSFLSPYVSLFFLFGIIILLFLCFSFSLFLCIIFLSLSTFICSLFLFHSLFLSLNIYVYIYSPTKPYFVDKCGWILVKWTCKAH